MTSHKNTRASEMKNLRHAKRWTLQKIADKFGISRERVRQLVGNTGIRFGEAFKSRPFVRNDERHEGIGGRVGEGAEWEKYISNILDSQRIPHKLMGNFHPFDILLDNGLRIDVKSAAFTRYYGGGAYVFATHQSSRGRYADYFVCITKDTKQVYVIPASETSLYKIVIFPSPKKVSKWTQYQNRFDLLERLTP